jgi:hypothetical protein
MFCFAGLVGMGIESRRIRKWLASSTFASLSRPQDMPQEAVVEPVSYMGSFNPFPALVIGVTGAAMAAHAQTYLFQVNFIEDLKIKLKKVNPQTSILIGSNPPAMGKSACCIRRA